MKKIISLIIASLMICCFIGCGSETEKKAEVNTKPKIVKQAKNITEYVKNIDGIKVTEVVNFNDSLGSFLSVTIKDDIADDKLFLAEDCKKLLEALSKSDKYKNIKKVNVTIESDKWVDKYGNKAKQKLLSCNFKHDETSKVKDWENFNIENMFDLANSVWLYKGLK